MFRTLIFGAAALLGASLALADETFIHQINYDRPGGAYVSLPVADAAACAGQCARDGLCLAWSFQPNSANACALKAVVTPARAAQGITSGLAARAQHFASLVGAEMPAPEPVAVRPRAGAVTMPRDIRPPVLARRKLAPGELLGAPDEPL